jgi:hypothetical protein
MASTEMAGTAGEPAPKRLKLSPPPSTTNSTTTDPNYNNNNNLDKSSGNTDIDIAMAHHAKLHIKNQISMEQTREVQSGILCFVSESTTGFSGILKQRYVYSLILFRSSNQIYSISDLFLLSMPNNGLGVCLRMADLLVNKHEDRRTTLACSILATTLALFCIMFDKIF